MARQRKEEYTEVTACKKSKKRELAWHREPQVVQNLPGCGQSLRGCEGGRACRPQQALA